MQQLQLPLFPIAVKRSGTVRMFKTPVKVGLPHPLDLLEDGAHMVVNVSGGIDSDFMAYRLLELYQQNNYKGEFHLVHADLGRAEWHNTTQYVRDLAQRLGLPLTIVRRNAGDLIARIWQRWDYILKRHQETGAPLVCPFPDSKNRYCTGEMKSQPTNSWIKNHFKRDAVVISCLGVRAEESTRRSKEPEFDYRAPTKKQPQGSVSAKTLKRYVYDWNPYIDWKKADVWDWIHERGLPYHPAYKLGNKRLSCSMCILACENDLTNGALHNPDTYRELCRIEYVSGYSFKNGWWLSDLRPDLLSEEVREGIAKHKRRKAA
jgi:3'-phosphoadenosine 5'-phosphosulfate sulfotransferase (PAPS reductase)/FAD synthetase